MKDIILEVSRRYSHRGRGVRHRQGTKKQWYVFYLDENRNFRAKKIHSILVPYYKLKICKRIRCICGECQEQCLAYVKKASEVSNMQCPNGCLMPSLMTADDIIDTVNAIDYDILDT